MPTDSIHPATRLGVVALTTRDLERLVQFYQRELGMQVLESIEDQITLGVASASPGSETAKTPLVKLYLDPKAAGSDKRTTGLYHFAVLLPSRAALAQALLRLAENNYPLLGAADHLVSEAIYLQDPDGNGIELYRDRPRSEWPYRNGQLQMATDPLNLRVLLGEADQPRWDMPGETRLGHIHLRVNGVKSADTFYVDMLGFDMVLHYGPQAGFVSAGGYHHHIGYNTWESAGAPPPPAGSAGLRYYSIVLPDQAALNQVYDRILQTGTVLQERPDGWLVHDPAGNAVLLTCENFS